MTQSETLKYAGTVAALAGVYFATGELGVQLAAGHASAAAAWPCAGIAIAALLVFSYRVWPGILFGAFLVQFIATGGVAASIGIAVGNTLEGLAALYLVSKFARGKEAFERAQDVFKFAVLAGLAAIVGASMGVAALAAAGFARWESFWPLWASWWAASAAGAVIATPVLLTWYENRQVKWHAREWIELAALFVGMLGTGALVFGGGLGTDVKGYPLEYLIIPFLIWAAFRFGLREAATCIFAVDVIAAWSTMHGYGPFARESQNTSLLLLQGFMGIIAIATLVLAVEATAHRRAEEQVRNLEVSDALTGLGNYRLLIEALETEIKRFGRTERPFVVLLLDLDGLKKINAAHGYMTGSRALCRLADMLRLYSREMDTAARFGPDEFVLILPETDAEAARLVAQRITKRLAEDGEDPKLTVSIGMAIYPDDGETTSEILAAADRDLYREKGVPKKRFVLPS
jgi:diguanylate cyclase (GGDEF)-like protein